MQIRMQPPSSEQSNMMASAWSRVEVLKLIAVLSDETIQLIAIHHVTTATNYLTVTITM